MTESLQKILETMRAMEWKRYAVPAAACFLAGLIIASLPAILRASPDFVILVLVMLALGGLLVFDILTRRRWEDKVADQMTKLSTYHDRLVREVARSRNDIAILKEGLAEAASVVEAQGRRMGPAISAEARMIETIVTQLGALGEKPRAELEARPESRQVLELEMAPPPKKRPPVSDLDEEFDPDFDRLDDSTVLDMVRHAVRSDMIDIFIQPVVSLPQRKARLYEVFARIRAGAGTYLPAAHYMDVAQREHLVPAIDNLLLLRCLQLLRARGDDDTGIPYALNISGTTLNDRGFMGDLVNFLSQHRHMAKSLIFELPQDEIDGMDNELVPVLDGLSKLGCRFSMDRVHKRQIDINILKSRHIRFIKMDAAWLLREGGTKTGYSRIVRFKKQLDTAGIDLVVEKIEKEQTLRELLDYNIDLGQGYLFGKPDVAAAFSHKKRAA